VASRLLACGLAVALALAAATAAALAPGMPAPELGADDLDGRRVTIAGLRGRVVVVDVWASWCAPCAASLPVYQRLYVQHRDRGLTVVGISVDGRVEDTRRFAREHGVTFPVLPDGGFAVVQRWRAPQMPMSYLVDRRGIIRYLHGGFEAGDVPGIEREIATLLAEAP
jgi:peroxiredoxin